MGGERGRGEDIMGKVGGGEEEMEVRLERRTWDSENCGKRGE